MGVGKISRMVPKRDITLMDQYHAKIIQGMLVVPKNV
jgi:hypothetical protein